MSTTSDQMREQQVHRLESQLQFVEGSAAETRGGHEELHRTTLAVFAAEEHAASVGQQYEEHARREAAIA
eukprot:4657924-Lingulodinium_polyedra.AAC.1